MSNLALKFHKSLAEELTQAYIPEIPAPWEWIELKIRLDARHANVRELSSFLAVIDGVFGRVRRQNYLSYSHSQYDQLKISEIRTGSTELIIADAISNLIQATPYVVLLLFVRYLGIGIKGISEVSKNFTDSYKSLQEGRLAKINQKKIVAEMEEDEQLRSLSPSDRRALVRLLHQLEEAERGRLPAARRFAKKSLIDVKLEKRRSSPLSK